MCHYWCKTIFVKLFRVPRNDSLSKILSLCGERQIFDIAFEIEIWLTVWQVFPRNEHSKLTHHYGIMRIFHQMFSVKKTFISLDVCLVFLFTRLLNYITSFCIFLKIRYPNVLNWRFELTALITFYKRI